MVDDPFKLGPSKVPSDLEIFCSYEISQPLWPGDITGQWRTQGTLQKAQLGDGDWGWALTYCQDPLLYSAPCLCENSNPAFFPD